jgi:hypothetical protein
MVFFIAMYLLYSTIWASYQWPLQVDVLRWTSVQVRPVEDQQKWGGDYEQKCLLCCQEEWMHTASIKTALGLERQNRYYPCHKQGFMGCTREEEEWGFLLVEVR